MKKKILYISLIIFLILVILGFVTSYIDSARVRNAVEPKFVIKIVSDDGNKVTYWGLGYKVIRYPSVSPSEPYKNNKGVKYGNWFMKYELNKDSTLVSLQELDNVNNKIIEYFTYNSVNEYDNYSYNYVDYENNVVIVGLIDNSYEKQEEFRKLVVDSPFIKFEMGEIKLSDVAEDMEIE